MEVQTLLIISFAIAIGEQLCVPTNDWDRMTADNQSLRCPWCPSPQLKIVYGVSNILGFVFLVIAALYITFSEHWWYFLVYLIGLPISKLACELIRLLLYPIRNKYKYSDTYGLLRFDRFLGTCVVLLSFIIFIFFTI